MQASSLLLSSVYLEFLSALISNTSGAGNRAIQAYSQRLVRDNRHGPARGWSESCLFFIPG